MNRTILNRADGWAISWTLFPNFFQFSTISDPLLYLADIALEIGESFRGKVLICGGGGASCRAVYG